MLDDEERGDTELRNQFKDRWTRTVSATLTGPLREEAKKYMDIIQNAINADKVVQEKFRMNRDCIVLLSKQSVSLKFRLLHVGERQDYSGSERVALHGSMQAFETCLQRTPPSSSTKSPMNFHPHRLLAHCAIRSSFVNCTV